jgi:hypothetical protein
MRDIEPTPSLCGVSTLYEEVMRPLMPMALKFMPYRLMHVEFPSPENLMHLFLVRVSYETH